MGEEKRGEKIALLPVANGIDAFLFCRAFSTVIIGPIVVVTVVIVLSVGLVVFLIIGNEVIQREPVMGGDEVDARPGPAAALVVEIARAEQACGEICRDIVALPVFAHRIAIFVVPFGPAGRKTADLITARTDIPGLADQLQLRQDRILRHRIEKAATLVESFRLSAQNGAEIEAETVDMHVFSPVTQAVHHHLQHARMRGVDGISGAGVVDVITVVIRQGAVIGEVVDTLERQRRSKLVAFRCVVVDHIENDLDAGIVERPHHIAEPLDTARTVIA
ncbi:hypothetical protein D3C71_772050 [compost metagenome]